MAREVRFFSGGFGLPARCFVCGVLLLALCMLCMPPTARCEAGVSQAETIEAVDKVSDTIEKVGLKLWELSEVSLMEFESSAYLKTLLKKNGFKLTSEGTSGVPTAFVAEFGSGKPVLGIMLEYDALPDLGNEVVPFKKQREDGVTAGHACGHNLIGAGALGLPWPSRT